MENVTHTLLGVVMAKAGLERLTPLAVPTCVIAANLPDIDAISILGGRENYFDHHRGITHSFVGICVLSVLLTLAVKVYDRQIRLKRNPSLPSTAFSGLLLVSFLALLSHLALDYTNSYGIRPFLPWSGRWFYGDLVFIIDPWIWLILGSAVLSFWKYRHAERKAALVSLAVLLFYWGALFVLHGLALHRVAQWERDKLAPKGQATIAAIPTFGNPLEWKSVVATSREIFTWRENLLATPGHFSGFQSFNRPRISTGVAGIAQEPLGKYFLLRRLSRE